MIEQINQQQMIDRILLDCLIRWKQRGYQTVDLTTFSSIRNKMYDKEKCNYKEAQGKDEG